MHLVDKVKLLEKELDKVVAQAYPAFKQMLMVNGADQIEKISHGIQYDFDIQEKKVTVGGMGFSSIDVKIPQQELFFSFNGTDANTDATISKFFELLSILAQTASVRTIVWLLADEVRKTQRRVNALDKMIIPQAKETKVYIESVLEERERENVFVLKALKKKNSK